MKECQLKDICAKGSSNLKQKDVEGQKGVYPVFGASGEISKIDTYHQEKDYIAIVKDGSGIGRVAFLPAKSSVIGTMQYILPKPGYDIKYIGYCIQSLDLSKYKQGAAIPHIYFRDYGERVVKVEESLPEQQRIVSQLDSSFAKIDALKTNAGKMLDEAKALFAAALREAMKPKEGWEEKRLGEVCNFFSGFAFKSNLFRESGIPIIRISDIQNQNVIEKNNVFCDPKDYKEDLTKYIIYPNDILIAMSGGTTGKIGINNTGKQFLLNQRVGAFREDKGKLEHMYLYYYLFTKSEESLMIAAGAAQPNLSTAQIKSFLIPLPPLPEQTRIVAYLDNLSAMVRQLEANFKKVSEECDALKQAILRETFE